MLYVQWEETITGNKEILNRAIALNPEERFTIVEGLLKSPDEPDRNLDEIWAEESEKRLVAYREHQKFGREFKKEVKKAAIRIS